MRQPVELGPSVTISQQDWSLHRKGPIDQARHDEKVREVIKGDLGGIIGEENIITSDGNKTIKIPIRGLDLPRFRFDPHKQKYTGTGSGDSQIGDSLGPAGDQGVGPGRGKKAGDQPGIDYYDAEITIDELAALVFQDLGLPNLQQKQHETVSSPNIVFNDVRRRGLMGNLDKRRTIMENIKRNALAGNPHVGGIRDDDLRFRTWNDVPQQKSNAVVIAMRDVSGSMGEFEKYITRSMCFWMVRFLRTKYTGVEIVFLQHHTEAKEVDEDTFFKAGESGGTMVSSAYRLANNIIDERYNPDKWNAYPFHFSDGDNWGEVDNRKTFDEAVQLVGKSSSFGYGEIRRGGEVYPTTLSRVLAQIQDPRFVQAQITKKEDVYPALQKFFPGTPSQIEGRR